VSERFGVGLTTQSRINNRVMDFLIDILATIINLNEGTVNLSREFQKVNIQIKLFLPYIRLFLLNPYQI